MTKLRVLVATGRAACEQMLHPSATAFGKQFDEKTETPVLTCRETEVLRFVAEGLTNGQTAVQMKVSVKTVEKHRQCVMNKLNLHHTAGLAGYAFGRKLVFEEDFHRMLAQQFNGRCGHLAAARNSTEPAREITPREEQVLKLLAEGLVNKQIASELNISIKTVGNHRLDIMKRLGIRHVAGLTRYAMSKGLIDPGVLIARAESHAQAYLQI